VIGKRLVRGTGSALAGRRRCRGLPGDRRLRGRAALRRRRPGAHTPAHRPGPEPSAPAVDWTAFPAYRNAVPVLLYHSVGGKPSYLTTPVKLFAAQMRALWHGGFHAITMQQYVAYVHGRRGPSCSRSTTAGATPTSRPRRSWRSTGSTPPSSTSPAGSGPTPASPCRGPTWSA
jgi:hypothetical protein